MNPNEWVAEDDGTGARRIRRQTGEDDFDMDPDAEPEVSYPSTLNPLTLKTLNYLLKTIATKWGFFNLKSS